MPTVNRSLFCFFIFMYFVNILENKTIFKGMPFFFSNLPTFPPKIEAKFLSLKVIMRINQTFNSSLFSKLWASYSSIWVKKQSIFPQIKIRKIISPYFDHPKVKSDFSKRRTLTGVNEIFVLNINIWQELVMPQKCPLVQKIIFKHLLHS